MADERLRRWAAERLPALLARAEEEALAEVRAAMRDALVEAALEREGAPRRRKPEPAAAASVDSPHDAGPSTEPAAEAPTEPTGEAFWLYAVGRDSPLSHPVAGIAEAPVRALEDAGLTALVSPVPLPEFGEEQLKEKLNDLGWLEGVARAHQRVVDEAFERGPVVPLRLCTIYQGEAGVRELLRERHERFRELLDSIEGREEWGVKLYVDPEELEAAASARSEKEAPDHGLGAGGAYLARRRSARSSREAADRLAGEIAEEVHARLQDWASDAVVGRPQNPELSGHTGQMLLNGAYLVESERSQRFAQLVSGLEQRYVELGARLEISGPWPPYNFIAD
jgi:hypothetical protein